MLFFPSRTVTELVLKPVLSQTIKFQSYDSIIRDWFYYLESGIKRGNFDFWDQLTFLLNFNPFDSQFPREYDITYWFHSF